MNIRLLGILVIGFLFGCKTKTSSSTKIDEDSDTRFASHLRIFDEDSVVRIHIIRSDAKQTEFKMLLADQKPKTIPEDYIFIQTPIKHIAALSSTQIGMLDKVGSIETINAVSNEKYIYNPILLKKIGSGTVTSLGDEGIIPVESLIRSGSKFVIYSDFGKDFPHSEKLAEMGIICIPNSDWRETHPLGKAEWIKFFGYLTGKKETANAVFQETVKAYTELLSKTQNVKHKPLVTSGNMIGDIWFAPAGESYNALLLKHAGANYIYKTSKGNGSTERSAEQVIIDNQKTALWINPGFTTKQEIVRNFPKAKYLSFFAGPNIYCYSFQMNKFWEYSASEPHHVLEDLIRIFHPEILPDGKMYFYSAVQ
jgi:iron complex transport system substrate-binding protein